MSNRAEPGTVIEWNGMGRGRVRVWRGRVIAFVPKNTSAFDALPADADWAWLRSCADVSTVNDRYIVQILRDGKPINSFRCPRAPRVEFACKRAKS